MGDADDSGEPGVLDLTGQQLADLLAQQFIDPVDASVHAGPQVNKMESKMG